MIRESVGPWALFLVVIGCDCTPPECEVRPIIGAPSDFGGARSEAGFRVSAIRQCAEYEPRVSVTGLGSSARDVDIETWTTELGNRLRTELPLESWGVITRCSADPLSPRIVPSIQVRDWTAVDAVVDAIGAVLVEDDLGDTVDVIVQATLVSCPDSSCSFP